MAYRAFEGKNISSIYHKFRFVPPDEMKNIIVQYLDQMVSNGYMYCDFTV